MKQLLITILTIFSLNYVYAQSHNPGPNSNCKLNKNYRPNIEKISCPACELNDKKEKVTKVAEDKRRSDIVLAKAKAEKEALDKAYKDKLALDAKKREAAGVVVVSVPVNVDAKNKTIAKKVEAKSLKANYFHSDMKGAYLVPWDINSMYASFKIGANKSVFFVGKDTLFRNNEFKLCVGLPVSIKDDDNLLYNLNFIKKLNFPPNIGIVVLNEQKTITFTRKDGSTAESLYPISDLVGIDVKRILNDNDITFIIHFADDYFILLKGYYAHVGCQFANAEIYNLKTKKTYPMRKASKNVIIANHINKLDYVKENELWNKETYKAFIVTTIGGWQSYVVYYITTNGTIAEQVINK
jgi:hypothetical protein